MSDLYAYITLMLLFMYWDIEDLVTDGWRVVYVCVLRLQYRAKVSSHALFIYILLSKDADLLVHFYSYPEQ